MTEDDFNKLKGYLAKNQIREKHYAAIGELTVHWAAFEAIVTSAIWQIAEIPDPLGACVTSQIFTFDGKMKALISILYVRGDFEDVIAKLNKFHERTKRLQSYRNRLAHDPAYFSHDSGQPQRLQITADKKLVYGFREETTENILKRAAEIDNLIDQFCEIIAPATDRFPSLPLRPEQPARSTGGKPT